jgi:hypothetical protein
MVRGASPRRSNLFLLKLSLDDILKYRWEARDRETEFFHTCRTLSD